MTSHQSTNHVPAPIVAIRDLRFRYPGMSHDALWMPALDIGRPGLVAVTGPSGAGKSTLIELMAGTLSERYSGSVRVLGKEWAELRRDRSRQFHLRRIGLIPQDLGLLPNGTSSYGQGVNDAGVVVGACNVQTQQHGIVGRAFVYANGHMTDLNTLLPAGSGWNLQWATAIASNGQITGFGLYNGLSHAYLLTPTGK